MFFVLILFIKNDHLLLLKRRKEGFGKGFFSIVGGRIEEGESATHAALREAKEEVGVTLEEYECVHTLFKGGEQDTLTCFLFLAKKWRGTPQNLEPDKHDSLEWFPLKTPPENLLPAHKHLLKEFFKKTSFSEFGF